jgi:predicted SAM-dependent methyltransferase
MSKIIEPWQNHGSPPPKAEAGEACPDCGYRRFIELGGGRAEDAYHPNLDLLDDPNVDYRWDLSEGRLPFHAEHADRIKAIHVLNHISRAGGRRLLKECYRVLRPGGTLYLMVPDLAFICQQIVADGALDEWVTTLHGTPGDEGPHDFHLWNYSRQTLFDALREAGFEEILFEGYYNRWEFKMVAVKLPKA